MTQADPIFRCAIGDDVIEASIVAWDSEVLGAPVAQIDRIEISDNGAFAATLTEFERWRDALGCAFVSCRLPHTRLRESMQLEDRGFRFIEMVFCMELRHLDRLELADSDLQIVAADPADIPELARIAETGFRWDRFHVDPRLGAGFGGRRYARWVTSTLVHQQQRLLKIIKDELTIGFFIYEELPRQTIHWQLIAIAPTHVGQGYGRQYFLALLHHHRDRGFLTIRGIVSANNMPIVNLLSSLNFRVTKPQITLHWIRPGLTIS
ncbi:MAG: GNAT family N-acetyltransferase [Azospirillaceae bacterium]|nr:GNAT family N-acetyltransferase [Azospirillaceae bacterium]